MTSNIFETGLTWLVRASWQAAALGLIVLVVSWALRARLEARWRFCLWLVVLLRLAIPATPSAPWSVFQIVPSAPAVSKTGQPQEIATTTTPVGNREFAKSGPIALPQPGTVDIPPSDHNRVDADGAISKAKLAPTAAAPSGPALNESNATFGTAKQWLALGWLVVLLALLVRQGWLHVRLYRRRRTWHEISDPVVQDIFRGCRNELRMRGRVNLLMTADDSGPATFGAFRPSILLPEKLLPLLSREELRLVLLHELIHVRRRDVLLDRVAFLLVAAHWFNPVAWLALTCLRRERELACDAAVLRRLAEPEFGQYGHALLKIAERQSALVSGAVGVFGKNQSLIRRINVIAKFKKPMVAGKVLGWLAILGLAAIGLTDAMAQTPDNKGKDQVPPAAKKEEKAKTISIAGVCHDKDDKPIAGAQVMLYREDRIESKVERLRTETTGDDGRFEFREVAPLPNVQHGSIWYALAVVKKGNGSMVRPLFAGNDLTKPIEFKLGPAAALKGRVTNAEGKPVAGARVWSSYGLPIDGVHSTLTDADGRYAIADMSAWGGPETTKSKPQPTENPKVFLTFMEGPRLFNILHPDYAESTPFYRSIPATVDAVLQPAGIIEGRAVDQVTGKAASGKLVWMQGINANEGHGGGPKLTGPDGKYRYTSVAAGKYNLWAEAPDRACAALDSFAVEAGKTKSAPDLTLVEGGWIEGRLVDAGTGKPFSGAVKEGRLTVGLYGPSRPKSGAAVQSCAVDDQGHFSLRVAPGVNFPYIMRATYWERTQRSDYFKKGIDVRAGEAVNVVFHILPTKPLPDPEPALVRLPIPVQAERQAAARIRQLGGNYTLDTDKHVVFVNMVKYENPSGRDDINNMTDTDEALRTVPAFSRLKWLMLCKGQATDDGLKGLAALDNLESLAIEESQVTGAGVAHLTGLKKLKYVDFRDGRLGDDALAAFGQMRELRNLGLTGNSFSDDGLKNLAELKQLRWLSIGMNRPAITDAGVKHLAGLTALEFLDLQKAQLTDTAVIALKDLKQLRTLYLNGTNGAATLTDASVEPLLGMTKLKSLVIQESRLTEQGVLRLLALPDLKDLSVAITSNPERLKKEIKQKRPGLKVQLFGPAAKE